MKKVTIIVIIVGSLGIVTGDSKRNIKDIGTEYTVEMLQKKHC